MLLSVAAGTCRIQPFQHVVFTLIVFSRFIRAALILIWEQRALTDSATCQTTCVFTCTFAQLNSKLPFCDKQ